MGDPKVIFCAAVIPALLVVLAVLGGRAWREGRERWVALPGIAIALAFVIGMPCLVSNPRLFSTISGWHWLFWIAAAAGVVGIVELLLPRKPAIVLLLGAVVIGASYYLLARSWIIRPRNAWEISEAIKWISISSSAALAMWLTGNQLSRRTESPRAAACAFAFITTLSAVTIGFLGKSADLANLAGIPAACAGVLALLTLVMPHVRFSLGTWFAIALLWSATLTASLDQWYSSLPMLDGLLLLFAPLTAWAALLADRRRWYAPAAVAIIAAIAAVAIPVWHIVETVIEYREKGFM